MIILRILMFITMIISSLATPVLNMVDRSKLKCTVCINALKSMTPSYHPSDFSFKSIRICNSFNDTFQQIACGEILFKNAKQFVKDQINKVLPITSCINSGVNCENEKKE